MIIMSSRELGEPLRERCRLRSAVERKWLGRGFRIGVPVDPGGKFRCLAVETVPLGGSGSGGDRDGGGHDGTLADAWALRDLERWRPEVPHLAFEADRRGGAADAGSGLHGATAAAECHALRTAADSHSRTPGVFSREIRDARVTRDPFGPPVAVAAAPGPDMGRSWATTAADTDADTETDTGGGSAGSGTVYMAAGDEYCAVRVYAMDASGDSREIAVLRGHAGAVTACVCGGTLALTCRFEVGGICGGIYHVADPTT
jgi:hypothetical protein